MVVCGGCNLIYNPDRFVTFSQLGLLSPDGRCKTFTANANGYGKGEGASVVILKKLSQAIKHGNRIYCIIKGTGISEDGFTRYQSEIPAKFSYNVAKIIAG
jgi:acyl transferase domain-containing protein